MDLESMAVGINGVKGFYIREYIPYIGQLMGRELAGKLFLSAEKSNKEAIKMLLRYFVVTSHPGLAEEGIRKEMAVLEARAALNSISPDYVPSEKLLTALKYNERWVNVEQSPRVNGDEGRRVMQEVITGANNTFFPYKVADVRLDIKEHRIKGAQVLLLYGFDEQIQTAFVVMDRTEIQSMNLKIGSNPNPIFGYLNGRVRNPENIPKAQYTHLLSVLNAAIASQPTKSI